MNNQSMLITLPHPSLLLSTNPNKNNNNNNGGDIITIEPPGSGNNNNNNGNNNNNNLQNHEFTQIRVSPLFNWDQQHSMTTTFSFSVVTTLQRD